MAATHRSYRFDEGLLSRLREWADAHGTTEAEAVRRLLTAALDAETAERGEGTEKAAQTADADVRAMLGEHIRDLRATISTLTAQLHEKDEQLAQALTLADHAQALQAAHAQTQLLGTTEPAGVSRNVGRDGARAQGWCARLGRWIAGDE